MSNRLASYAELADFLETDILETQPEGKPLGQLLDAMTSVFERHLQRTLSLGTYTEDFWGEGTTVPLAALPVTSVTSVTYDGATLTSSDYTLSPAGLRLKNLYLEGITQITVAYQGGYAVNGSGVIQVPADIKQAALYQVAAEWRQKDKPGASVIETAAGRLSVSELTLLAYVRELLHPFRHPYYLI